MPHLTRFLRILVASVLTAGALMSVGPAPEASAAVQSCSSSTPIASRPLLRKGDTGSCVKVLQNLLVAKGYTIGSSGVDGDFGTQTDNAVRRFQSDYVGLAIDGLVGQQTWSTLVNGGTRYTIGKGPNRSSYVVLTFDDCPKSLDAFKATVLGAESLGIALTLQPTGDCLLSGRFDAAFARAHGAYVFNHSITHPDLTTLSYAQAYAELGSPGVVTNYGRPPYGSYNTLAVRNAYAQRAMRIWTWSLDTRDWEGKSMASVVSYVINNAHAGDTVLMHMGWNAFNKTALSQMKSGLADRGLAVCRNKGATAVRPAFSC